MNILYITNHLNVGGITSYVLTLAKGLKQKGHNIYLASSGGELLLKFMEAGIIYIPIPIKTKSEVSLKILASMFKLSKAIKQNHIDIMHSHSHTTQVLGCLLKRNTGVAHISTCHGFFKPRLFRKMFPCWRDKVIAISEAVSDHLREDFGVSEENIRVIHNGIDVDRFKNPCLSGRQENLDIKIELRKNLGLGKGSVVGIIARLSDVKGHIYLIRAMKTVLEKMPEAQLLIVGEGKMEKQLVNLTKSLNIEKNVFFVPKISNTNEVLSIMDLFVMPSLKEGLGLALMEAMAAGVAVIGSEVGGIKTLIQNGFNGILVKPADTAGLSCAILDLLSDTAKRQLFSNNARIFIEQNFSQEKMVSETEEVYRECLGAEV